MRIRALLAGVFVCATGSGALADEGLGDIWITTDGTRVVTGGIEEFPGLEREVGIRVFVAELGETLPGFADEPGLRVLEGEFAGGTPIGFTINRGLREWNGSSFDLLSSLTMSLLFGPASATTSATDQPVPGFTVPTDPDGDFHDHYTFRLDGGAAASGIWLLDLSFTAPGLAPSEPVWVIFHQNADAAAVEAAEAFAVANVPTPGAISLLAIAGGIALRRRR